MSIDTEIKGKPSNIESAASWLRDKLEIELTDAGDEFNNGRKDASASWNCGAGDAFAGKMKTARDKTDDLAKAAKGMATKLDDFAGDLRTCQSQMATCRTTATKDKLTVNGFLIEDPGAGPERPPDNFTGTQAEVDAHNQKVTAYDNHQDLIRAFTKASREAGRIDRLYGKACTELQDKYTPGQHAAWMLTLGEITGEGAFAYLAISAGLKHRSLLLNRASDLITEATNAIDEMQRHPERYVKRKWLIFKTLDTAKLNADKLFIEGKFNEAEDLLKQARSPGAQVPDGRLPKGLKLFGKILGPVGFGLGVYNDYQEGESTTQIAVSQGASVAVGAGVGWAASIGTGAAVGAAFGSVVPGAGTAVGAVVGVVVGAGIAIFSDGAIDSLFENGPDVSKAAEEGLEALKDTGGAIKDGVSSVGNAIGGLFD